jgi:hypothetical protein
MLKHIAFSLFMLVSSSVGVAERSFDAIVHSHIEQMLAEGYAQSLSWDDLYHGHIMVKRGEEDCYGSLDELLGRTEVILYHTAEHNYRWGSGATPPEQKIPRSVIGFMDGTIEPAIDFVGQENLESDLRYVVYGTVGIEDIVQKRPDLYTGNRIGDNTCVKIDGEERPTSFEFHIDENGAVTFGRE